jgi:hypothetical protein
LKAAFQRVGGEVDKMAERLDRLDAAREALALHEAETGARRLREDETKSNPAQAFDNKRTGETVHFAPSIISEA